jgi:UDPglucose 6-dehydrogenase
MKIAVVGTGYVGLVSGVGFAELGHEVICVDNNAEKIKRLEKGEVPIYEPGLEPLLKANEKAGRIRFTGDLAQAVRASEAVFIAVGTPTLPSGQPDIRYVEEVASAVAPLLDQPRLVVNKSTVPVGMGKKVAEIILKANPKAKFEVASNPEFLREGSAVQDFLQPHRVVVGTETARAKELMEAIYKPLAARGAAVVYTDIETAEMIKYAANCFLATKIAFINEVADLCEKVGADIQGVAHGIGLDPRIGKEFLQTGPGYGGSCFPKDTVALSNIARGYGTALPVLEATIESNRTRKLRMADRIISACGGSLQGKTIAILGLAFKANTDDLRDSVSLVIIPELLKAGASIRAYDPQGMHEAKKLLPGGIHWSRDGYDCIGGADAAVILTEWQEFRDLDLARVKASLVTPLLIDMRNLWDVKTPKSAGLRYISLGRQEG